MALQCYTAVLRKLDLTNRILKTKMVKLFLSNVITDYSKSHQCDLKCFLFHNIFYEFVYKMLHLIN